jgi:isopentenyl phosphate kinase
VDVTGGMAAKVTQAVAMVTAHPGMDVLICSGLAADHLLQALNGVDSDSDNATVNRIGTRIYGA